MCWGATIQFYYYYLFIYLLVCMSSAPSKWLDNLNWLNLPHMCMLLKFISIRQYWFLLLLFCPPHTDTHTHTSCLLHSAPWLLYGVSFSVLTYSPLTCFTIINSTNLQEIQSVPWTDVKLSQSPSTESYRLYDFIHHAQMGGRQPYCTIFSHFPFDELLSEGACFDLICSLYVFTQLSTGHCRFHFRSDE